MSTSIIWRCAPQKLLALLVAGTWIAARPAAAQSYGLPARAPFGAYLNGKLPATNPGSGAWSTENAFPHLTFQNPIKILPQPGSNRLWVIGREGHVYSFVNDSNTTQQTLVLDLSAQTQGRGDCGLLGIAFHPDFGKAGSPNRNYVFLYYNFSPAPETGGGIPSYVSSFNRLSRFTLPDGATTIDRSSEFVLINQFDRHALHNGGDMYFGPDGFLYLTNGDEGSYNDEFDNAQRIDRGLFSGVLRIDVDRDASRSHPIRRQPQGAAPPPGWPDSFSQGYFIPNDNPWLDPSGSVLEEFYAIGLRSPHRMSYDAVSGQTFIGDLGQDAVEEIDLLAKGANYQWPFREGNAPAAKSPPDVIRGTSTPPLYDYNHATGHTCVIGGFVYRGADYAAELGGKYIFGDNISGAIWSMVWDQGEPRVTQLTSANAADRYLSGFGFDQRNELYLMTVGSGGRILKFTRPVPPPQPPATLSATGVFADLAMLTPSAGVIPYDVNAPFWSDGAVKRRWIALPNNGNPFDAADTIAFASTGAWQFPAGTVFIKHFELPIDARNPMQMRRLETRLLVRDSSGGTYGVTYRWRADQSDADLLPNALTEDITITDADGTTRAQPWDYPSRDNCQTCHTPAAGGVLGVKTAQLNGSFLYPSTGIADNQLRTWAKIGMFSNPPPEASIVSLPKLVGLGDTSASLEVRVRSYLDTNCAQCHRPGGARGLWDGRFETPLAQQGIVNGPVLNALGLPGAWVIAPGRRDRSIAYLRLHALDGTKMPFLAKNVIHTAAVDLLGEWIDQFATGPLPASWTLSDIGAPALAGRASSASGTFLITGSGADISNATDQFFFASRSITGDGEILARVVDQANTNDWAKAGVMFRESSDPGARHAMVVLTPVNGTAFQWRADPGEISLHAGAPSNVPPNNWVRLVRRGGSFYAYRSSDGIDWHAIGSASIPMASTVEVGLAVTSHDNFSLSTATFDNVQINAGETLPPPSVVLALPGGTTYTAPANIALATNIAANGNAIAKVQFLNGATLIGESTAAPFTFTWEEVTAGTYSLFARVITAIGTQADSPAVSVSVAGPPPVTVPAPWISRDIGGPSLAGSASYLAGVYVVNGSGADISNGSDQFHYVWQQFAGDGEITARVVNQTNTNDWAKAGVMFRETLEAGSRHAMVVLTPVNGTAFQWRVHPNEISLHAGAASNVPPNNWLRLVRSGDTFTAYRSADGITWRAIGTANIPMAATVAAGLAVTSHDNTALSTATFDNVQITSGGTLPPAGVALALPGGTTYTAPANIALAASVTANGNPIAKVQFRNGQTVIGESTAAPFGFTWQNVAAGIYSLSARVITATGAASDSNAVSVTVSGTPSITVPAPWSGQDIGGPSLAGSANYQGGVYTVAGSGADISNASDQFQYVWQPFIGDGEFIARVTSQTNTNDWAKAGVMFRETLQPNSRHAMMVLTPVNGTAFQFRALTGDVGGHIGANAFPAPNNWLRLVRNGDLFAGYRSADGVSWTQVGSVQIPMATVITAGLAVSSHTNTLVSTAKFDDVRVLPSTLPEPWAGLDIGSPALTDVERFADGTYTIAGGGHEISGGGDQFHFVSKTMTGDGEVVARVTSQAKTAPLARAGVMIRESLQPSARNIAMLLTPRGFAFQTRVAPARTTTRKLAASNPTPNNWVRLVRQGRRITAYHSADGSKWRLLGSATMSLPATIHVGFAVSAGNNRKIGMATFDNVQIKP